MSARAAAAIVLAMTAAVPWPAGAQPVADRVAALDAAILRGPTATQALQRICGPALPVRAEVDRGASAPASAETRARLGVSDDAVLGYRRVRLLCGDRLLSEAQNWFVPARLAPTMRAELDAGTRPYGAVIAALAPVRRNLATERLWDGQGAPPPAVLRHRAIVLSGAGVPLAEVIETYQRGALGD